MKWNRQINLFFFEQLSLKKNRIITFDTITNETVENIFAKIQLG